jgi:sugar phosphate isomerase/epimerase
MKLGFVSDSLGGLPFQAVLDHAARIGDSRVEVNTGGWSNAPHFDLVAMKSSAEERRSVLRAFSDRGLEVISRNANGNPPHPTPTHSSRVPEGYNPRRRGAGRQDGSSAGE